MPETTEDLLKKITTAFKDAPFPSDGYDIYAAQTDDDFGTPHFTTEHLPGRRWCEVNDAQLDDCYAALTYLRPEGWRHYLPAWMIREVRTPYSGLDNLLWTLHEPAGEYGPLLMAKHKVLTPAQVGTIISYLEYYQLRERNIHAAHAHHRYAQMNITWTVEMEPWPGEEDTAAMLTYWKSQI